MHGFSLDLIVPSQQTIAAGFSNFGGITASDFFGFVVQLAKLNPAIVKVKYKVHFFILSRIRASQRPQHHLAASGFLQSNNLASHFQLGGGCLRG